MEKINNAQNENEEIDLFFYFKNLPKDIQKVFERFPSDYLDYEKCKMLIKEVQNLGYTFEYTLDAVPYGVKKITLN